MANATDTILGWRGPQKTDFGADKQHIWDIRGDLDVLQLRIATKADAGPIWKRVEEKADCSWVNWLEKEVVTKLRGEHDDLARRVKEDRKLLEQLPSKLQISIGEVLQTLCHEQFAAIGKLCEERLALLAALEKQTGSHAVAAAASQQETATAARTGVEDIRRELEALRTFADRTQTEFTCRLQAAEETARRAQASFQQCREDAAAKVAAAQQARDEAAQTATDARRLLAGCETLWGRLRWLLCGTRQGEVRDASSQR